MLIAYPEFVRPSGWRIRNRSEPAATENHRSDGAQERTRTSTTLRSLAPEASASTNSATWAQAVSSPGAPGRFGRRILSRNVLKSIIKAGAGDGLREAGFSDALLA